MAHFDLPMASIPFEELINELDAKYNILEKRKIRKLF